MTYAEAILSIEYDPASRRLTVAFDSFRKIIFYDVPPSVREAITDAPSPEDAFATKLVGKFAWTEMAAPDSGNLGGTSDPDSARSVSKAFKSDHSL